MTPVVATVQDWDDEEGWGVCTSPETPGGCWVHFSAVLVPGHRRLVPGQQVHLVAEAVEQDGWAFRAVRVWPVGQDPYEGPSDTGTGPGVYSSELTLTFDPDPDPDDPGTSPDSAATRDSQLTRQRVGVEPRPYLVKDLTVPLDAPGATGVRQVGDADLPALAGVMADTYRGTVDDEGEDQPAALRELLATAEGAHGAALRHAWLLYEEDGEPLAAVACTRWHQLPLVAYAFTHPSRQRRGISTRLLLSAAERLRATGETRLSLIVTRRNPAHQLYERLGFVEEPWPEGA